MVQNQGDEEFQPAGIRRNALRKVYLRMRQPTVDVKRVLNTVFGPKDYFEIACNNEPLNLSRMGFIDYPFLTKIINHMQTQFNLTHKFMNPVENYIYG